MALQEIFSASACYGFKKKVGHTGFYNLAMMNRLGEG